MHRSAASSRTLECGRELAPGLTLVRHLGAGGGGEVWLARQAPDDQPIAVKILSGALAHEPSNLAALERECAQARALDHPHILRVHGCGRSADHAWIAMEYAEGGDLSRWRGQQPLLVLRQAAPIAAALAYAHRAGVVHRDVKTTNVLLRADGAPALGDFGMAHAPAAPASGGRGSPYSMSPQQLAGEPARPSDDVYGFGSMLYELLSGYPPFYPAPVTAERIYRERPAALPRSTPEWAVRLIERMLAPDSEARPDMQTVERELIAALSAPSAAMTTDNTSVRIEPPPLRAPAAHGEPLRGEWRRAADSGVNAAELRRQGFRRGLTAAAIVLGVIGVLVVFFALPRWVDRQPAAQAPAPAAAPTTTAPSASPEVEIDFVALARAKQQADEVRTPLQTRLDKLTARAAEQWGGAEFITARNELAAGDAAYAKREYVAALAHFQRIEPLLSALEKRASAVLTEQLQAGAAALQAGRSADAQAAYGLALKIEPNHAAAAQGIKRANVLDEVLQHVAQAEQAERSGELSGALATFRKALSLDPQTTRASEGVARIEARLAGDAFASAMARGYTALAAKRYSEAREAFAAAARIRPQAPEIGQALRQIEQEERTGAIAVRLANAQSLERGERWADALREYQAIVQLDSTVAAANEGVARTSPRATLNEQLEMYLTQPERLFSQPVRAAAADTLTRARAIPNPGPVLQKQIATLTDWVSRANVPVQVALQSDNVTQVTIYRVGELGAFDQRSLELAPGTYTIVGTRPGYRDVRRQIQVAPGAVKEPVVIRCEDPI